MKNLCRSICLVLVSVALSPAWAGFLEGHPRLVITSEDVPAMKTAIQQSGRFQDEYRSTQKRVDALLEAEHDVPMPKDAGGGYTHEKHKQNYRLMYEAGVLYQLNGDKKYAAFIESMLLEYAALYPGLELHPEKKGSAPGRLFWQSLNEAVWLVYTIQAYDLVYDAISPESRNTIENDLFANVVQFIADDSPQTFDKIHNHGTWAAAAVGMTGYVLGRQEWVEKALLGLDKSGEAGYLKQLQDLFSPDGYYAEGPYYQRYAMMPFLLFAKSIDVNEPQRKIFEYRDGVLVKAVNTTLQLSYNGLFSRITMQSRIKASTPSS